MKTIVGVICLILIGIRAIIHLYDTGEKLNNGKDLEDFIDNSHPIS